MKGKLIRVCDRLCKIQEMEMMERQGYEAISIHHPDATGIRRMRVLPEEAPAS